MTDRDKGKKTKKEKEIKKEKVWQTKRKKEKFKQ